MISRLFIDAVSATDVMRYDTVIVNIALFKYTVSSAEVM
jgi:hypothetical protein